MATHHHIPVAVFDISSSSVAGAHVLIPKGETVEKVKASLLAQTRSHAALREDITIERFVDQTIEQIDKVATLLQKADHHRPHYIQILLASPWFFSQTRTIAMKRTAPFVCTQKIIDELVEKEVAYIMEHDMERFGSFGKDGIIIEKQLSGIKLNGYSTSNPFGKKAESLEIFLVVTVSPKMIIDRFKSALGKYYGHTPIGFTTSPYATYIVARDYLQAPTELMVVDVGEEITDVAFIKNGLFLYQHSFPIGMYELYRTLVKHNVSSVVEAEALLETFRLGKISETEKPVVQKSLDQYGALWQKSFEEVIGSGHYGFSLPNHIYIVGDYRFDAFFSTLVKNDPMLIHAIPAQTPEALFISQELIAPHIHSLETQQLDETIIIATLFTARLL